MGDIMTYKAKFLANGQFLIPAGSSQTWYWSQFNNLNNFLSQLTTVPAAGGDVGMGFTDSTYPPGFDTWMNQFKQYRINGIKFRLTLENEGAVPQSVTVASTATYTPYMGISFEGNSQGQSTTGVISNANYWHPAELKNNRWSRMKVIGQPQSTRGRSTLQEFISCAQLDPDYVERQYSNQGTITPNAPGTSPTFGGVTVAYNYGFCVGNLNGVANTTGIDTYFTGYAEITLYMQVWNKNASVSIL